MVTWLTIVEEQLAKMNILLQKLMNDGEENDAHIKLPNEQIAAFNDKLGRVSGDT